MANQISFATHTSTGFPLAPNSGLQAVPEYVFFAHDMYCTCDTLFPHHGPLVMQTIGLQAPQPIYLLH